MSTSKKSTLRLPKLNTRDELLRVGVSGSRTIRECMGNGSAQTSSSHTIIQWQTLSWPGRSFNCSPPTNPNILQTMPELARFFDAATDVAAGQSPSTVKSHGATRTGARPVYESDDEVTEEEKLVGGEGCIGREGEAPQGMDHHHSPAALDCTTAELERHHSKCPHANPHPYQAKKPGRPPHPTCSVWSLSR